MRLVDKTAVVSGASRNLGKAIALAFAREGADVIVVANKSADELAETAGECQALGVRSLPLQADVSDSAHVDRLVRQALEHFGKVDILVNAVAIRPQRPLWELGNDEWDQVMAVNLNPTFYLARALAPSMMKRRRGSIIAIGGLVTHTLTANRTAVRTSKMALHGLIKSIAIDLGPYGVRANQIIPGRMATNRRNPEWHLDAHEDDVKVGRPEDVANAALYLASDESSHVTGDRIICAGEAYG